MPTRSRLDHLVLTVMDIRRTVQFYEDVLGMQSEQFTPADGSVRTALKFGAQKINLHSAANPFAPHAEVAMPGSADLCFLSDDSPDVWAAHFATKGVTVEEGPVVRTGATGPIMSLYVRDPDGNLIEIGFRVSAARSAQG
jgi:catechol 2,3-dioxygenase-like lactoylglutathione lyase family enzyme